MDIQTTLQAIFDYGMTDAQIGKEINAPAPTVNRLRNGKHKTTDHDRGEKIRALAKKVERLKAEAKELKKAA